MKKIMGVMALAVAGLQMGCASLRTIEQATADESELNENVEITSSSHKGTESGKTAFPYLKALGKPPQKVALVSYVVQSPPAKSGNTSHVLTQAWRGRRVAMLSRDDQ